MTVHDKCEPWRMANFVTSISNISRRHSLTPGSCLNTILEPPSQRNPVHMAGLKLRSILRRDLHGRHRQLLGNQPGVRWDSGQRGSSLTCRWGAGYIDNLRHSWKCSLSRSNNPTNTPPALQSLTRIWDHSRVRIFLVLAGLALKYKMTSMLIEYMKIIYIWVWINYMIYSSDL